MREWQTEEDIDSCNMILTRTFKVRLQSTGEVFEISSDSNITHENNCMDKRKLVKAIKRGGLIGVKHVIQNGDDTVRLEDVSVDQFRTDMANLEQ